jgi:hypothetical protein
MSSKQQPPLTYTQAIDEYFGGVKTLAGKSLPFKCKCGSTTYPKKVMDKKLDMPTTKEFAILSIPECFLHIRKSHKERIKK